MWLIKVYQGKVKINCQYTESQFLDYHRISWKGYCKCGKSLYSFTNQGCQWNFDIMNPNIILQRCWFWTSFLNILLVMLWSWLGNGSHLNSNPSRLVNITWLTSPSAVKRWHSVTLIYNSAFMPYGIHIDSSARLKTLTRIYAQPKLTNIGS